MKTISLLILLMISGCALPNPTLHVDIASPIKGCITKNGIPIEGAIVTRKCSSGWYGEFPVETSTSNYDGFYGFPGITKQNYVMLLHTPTIWQEFTVSYKGKIYLAYKNFRMDYSKYGELNAKHKFDNKPHSGCVGTNLYVYLPDNRKYETKLSRKGKCLELNLDLLKLEEYTKNQNE